MLRRVFEQGAYAPQALNAGAAGLEGRDRALARRLAFGAVQRRLTLDTVIEALAERPVSRIEPALLAALRLGTYELLYSDGAPPYAVVDDAVRLARAERPRGAGLVNAVLRRVAREGAAVVASHDERTLAGAAVVHSHPPWIVDVLFSRLGPAAALETLAADNEPGELALRVNTLRGDVDALERELGVSAHRDALIPESLVLDAPLDVHATEAWREGRFTAQSRAAMLAARALAPEAGERVLDLCAAPGGKTGHLAELMRGEGEVVAVERDPARAERLRGTLRRLSIANVAVEVADAREFAAAEHFDRVLVDPPCSGLGTLQFRPDLRWRVEPGDVLELVAIQREILGCAARALRPGGMLVYSTCTISPDENERMIEDFLRDTDGFALVDLTRLYPPAAGDALRGTLQTLPGRDHTAGFFIAAMERA